MVSYKVISGLVDNCFFYSLHMYLSDIFADYKILSKYRKLPSHKTCTADNWRHLTLVLLFVTSSDGFHLSLGVSPL
jgi:hypothetical protein